MGVAFGVTGRLTEWQQAGLIDADVADRIAAHEAARGRPTLTLALIVLGCFTIATGIIAIVAANWDAIPIALRLPLHVAVNLGLGGLVWHWHRQGDADRAAWVEGAILLLSLSTLSLIAHIGQSFQLQGSMLGLVGTWLLLVTPFTLVMARGGLNRWVWLIGVAGWIILAIDDQADWLRAHQLITAAPILASAVIYATRAAAPPLHPGWSRHIGQAAGGLMIASTTIILLVLRPLLTAEIDRTERIDIAIAIAVGLTAIAAAHLLVPADRRGARLGFGLVLMLSPPIALIPFLIPDVASVIVGGVLFCAYWVALARLALLTGRTGWFRLAVGLIAAQVFAVYLEATGGLLATGFGLIFAGMVLLALAFAARRVMQWGARA